MTDRTTAVVGEFDAVILAGGRGWRLGGVVKPDVVFDGARLLDRVLRAVSGARQVVVVGSLDVPAWVSVTHEEPEYGGPAAGVAAGVAALRDAAPWTLLLASDLVHPTMGVQALADALPSLGSAAGACLLDSDGHLQWLLGIYRSERLRAALAAFGDPANRSLRSLLGPLEPVGVPAGDDLVADIDTWDDHDRWTARLAAEPADEGDRHD